MSLQSSPEIFQTIITQLYNLKCRAVLFVVIERLVADWLQRKTKK